MSAIACVALWLGLTAGNVIYAHFSGATNAALVERAYFQGAAFLAVYLYLKLTK